MAGTKISALTSASTINTNDLVAVVDIAANQTKKVTSQTLSQFMVRYGISVGPTQPANPYEGQPWMDTGVAPPALRVYNGAGWTALSISATSVVTSPGATAPTSPANGVTWWDTGVSPPVLRVYNSGTASWEQASPSGISQTAADARYLLQSTAASTYLPLAGGTMTGALTLPGNPTTANHAATKAYVDAAVSGTATTTWTLTQDIDLEKIRFLKWTGGPTYANSRAALAVGVKDTQSLGANQFAQAAYFNFQFTGDGVVSAGSYLSQSIWQGLYVSAVKSGDGSGHCFTAGGELRSVGASGYNELGMFVGEITNTGSSNATMSGVEVLVKDGVAGGSNYPTQLDGCIGRVAKFNGSSRRSACFTGSSEGSQPVQAVLTTSSGGLNQWQYGVRLDGASITSGYAITMPYQTSIAATNGSGSLAPALSTNATDTVLRPVRSDGLAGLQDYSGTTKFYVKQGISDPCYLFVGGLLKNVGQGPANSAGAGYRYLIVPN